MIKLPTAFPKKRGPKKQPKPLKYPTRRELAYTSELVTVSRNTSDLIDQHVIPQLDRLTHQANRSAPTARTDAASDDLDAIFENVYQALGLNDSRKKAIANSMLIPVESDHARAFADTYLGVIPVNPLVGEEPWLLDQMRLTQSANTKLIQSIPDTLLGEVESIVSRGIQQGTRVEDIATQIRARYPVSESKATLIARDQTGKWFGNLSRLRQLDAGVSKYEWSTSNDERVRPAHRARHGKVFRWDQPPPDGHPGQPVQCRCQAIAVIPDVDDIAPVPVPVPTPVPTPKKAPVPVPRPAAQLPALPAYGRPAPGVADLQEEWFKEMSKARRTMIEAEDRYEGELPASFRHKVNEIARKTQAMLGLKRTRSITSVESLPRSDPSGHAGGVMEWEGAMKLRVRKGVAGDELGFHTVVHETIHTLGGANSGAYRRVGIIVEEVVTEELAQAIGGGTTSVRDRVYAVEGAYAQWRSRMLSIIADVTGQRTPEAVTMHLRRAAHRWKTRTYDNDQAAVDAFIDALEPANDAQRAAYRRLIDDQKAWDAI